MGRGLHDKPHSPSPGSSHCPGSTRSMTSRHQSATSRNGGKVSSSVKPWSPRMEAKPGVPASDAVGAVAPRSTSGRTDQPDEEATMEMQSYAPGTPCWIDLGIPDPDGAAAFYGALFGWACEEGPPEAGGYRMCMLRGHAVAGLGPQMNPDLPPFWSTYIAVADADATARRRARWSSHRRTHGRDDGRAHGGVHRPGRRRLLVVAGG